MKKELEAILREYGRGVKNLEKIKVGIGKPGGDKISMKKPKRYTKKGI